MIQVEFKIVKTDGSEETLWYHDKCEIRVEDNYISIVSTDLCNRIIYAVFPSTWAVYYTGKINDTTNG
jgi:hypothetical protein